MKRLTITIAMLVAAAVAAPAADASSRQLLIMQDDARVRSAPSATLAEFGELGVDVVKLNLYWDQVAPDTRRKPSGFDGANPASYAWGSYDAAVQAILAQGMRPYLSIGGHAPRWSTGNRGRAGTYRPSAKEFRLFAQAAGQHYSEVDIWSIWNEPNLYSWLSPQRSKGTPLSPSIYRGLYLAGHRGLTDSGHGDDTILLGELMPRAGTSPRKVRPLEFLREMVCLDRSYRQIRGKAAKKRNCRKIRRIPTSGIAYHPYTLPAGPHLNEARDDAAIGQLARLRSTIDALARRGKLPRRLPIWITEFGFQTNPPDPFQGVRLKRAASFMDESEWIAFRNPRVAAYSQYTLVDDPPRPGSGPLRWSSWQSGLRFGNGKQKPHVYDAFRLPVFVRTIGSNRVEVFGGRRTLSAGSAQVEAKAPGARYRSLGSVPVNQAGYFRRVFRVRGAASRTFRVTLDGHSRVKRPVAR
ncbi:MAG: hypothetical protein QOH58_2215 [Thermoleophilaceae bacterium]|jgi:hypothetical protein|nr:hypothetical protein [Thermoleophilaceae bacterium]